MLTGMRLQWRCNHGDLVNRLVFIILVLWRCRLCSSYTFDIRVKPATEEHEDVANTTQRATLFSSKCKISSEASKAKLMDFFKKVKKEYYSNNRFMVSTNSDYDDKQLKQMYQPYMPTPNRIKENADRAKELLDHLNGLQSKFVQLNLREQQLVAQFRNFLESNFDNVYGSYYDGVWLMGPDYFCEQPICFVHLFLYSAVQMVKMRTLKDLELVIFWVKEHRKTFEQYQKNLEDGIKAGMVNPMDVCKAASRTFALTFSKVYYKGEKGALKMQFAQTLMFKPYYEEVSNATFVRFFKRHKQTFETELQEAIVNDFGKPLKKLIDYLREEYVKFCPPVNVSSGLGTLPLSYQYKDGAVQNDLPTTKKLPTGEDIDVNMGYRKFLKYYTTTNISGSSAMKLGYKIVETYYDKVLQLGYNVTEETDEGKMIEKFRKIIDSSSNYYNSDPFPSNESDSDAHNRCDDDDDAVQFCPTRWRMKNKWFLNIMDIMKKAKATIGQMFYEKGEKKTTPDCLIKIIPEYNPSNGVPSYKESDAMCTQPASYFVPFFKNKMGPKYEDINTNFHEARPGHHLQIQGYLENFGDTCGGISEWINDVNDYYPSFSEGWSLYSENPVLLHEAGVLESENKLSTYGVLKWQIWRALRLIVDVGFHEKNMTRAEALELFKKYTWDDSDTTEKELTRYQGAPGQATSYVVGQQMIWLLRNRTEKKLGDKFNIKDFHYHLLSQGQSPYDFVSTYMNTYAKCAKESNGEKVCTEFNGGDESKRRTDVLNVRERKVKALFQLFKKRKPM